MLPEVVQHAAPVAVPAYGLPAAESEDAARRPGAAEQLAQHARRAPAAVLDAQLQAAAQDVKVQEQPTEDADVRVQPFRELAQQVHRAALAACALQQVALAAVRWLQEASRVHPTELPRLLPLARPESPAGGASHRAVRAREPDASAAEPQRMSPHAVQRASARAAASASRLPSARRREWVVLARAFARAPQPRRRSQCQTDLQPRAKRRP